MDVLFTFAPLLLIGAVFYLLLFRPMQRRNREFAATQAAAQPGAVVMMGGGLIGTLVSVEGEDVIVEAAPGVHLRYTKQGVVKVLEPAAPDDSLGSTDPEDQTD